jgi:predicted DNA-binding transcriptional regulator YafY
MPAQPKHDTLSRLLELLKAIPHHRWATPRELQGQLAGLGFEVDVRSVQRDLKELQNSFPLEHNDKGRPHGWRWSAEAAGGIASMGAAEALLLVLVQRHLQEALPASMLEGFEPLFARARQRLDRLGPRAGATRWPDKVAAVPPGLKTLPPRCDPAVQKALADALLADRQIDAVYAAAARGRAKSYRLHPLGLVLRGHVTYLAATTGVDGSPLLFAVHRFKRVEMRLEPVSLPPGLDLKAALAAGRDQFRSHRQGTDEFVLELSCEPGLAALLEEASLGTDQVVEPAVQGATRLRVTVRDSWELRWWLMGRADQLEVLSPDWLRREIGEALRKASARYQRETGHYQVG